MKSLYSIIEGILDTTADNFEINLYSKGYRLHQINYKNASFLFGQMLDSKDTFDHFMDLKQQIEKISSNYGSAVYGFAKQIGTNTGHTAYIIKDQNSKSSHVSNIDYMNVNVIAYAILYAVDWRDEIKLLKSNHINDVKVKETGNKITIEFVSKGMTISSFVKFTFIKI